MVQKSKKDLNNTDPLTMEVLNLFKIFTSTILDFLSVMTAISIREDKDLKIK